MASSSSARWPRLTERRILRALLYLTLGVSAILLIVRYVVWVPGVVVPQTREFDLLVMLIRNRMDLSTLIVVFVLSLVGLAVTAEHDLRA